MKRFRRTILSLAISVLAISAATSQTNYELEIDTGKVSVMTMANGFTVFVREDSTSAMVHTEFLCRAGYSSQTPSTAGFFPLYARLFSTTKNPDGTSPFASVALTSSCNADSSTYTADVTREALDALVRDLAHCAQNPSFTDKKISEEYAAMKKESKEYASGTTGFINGTIDSKIHSDAPWKTQSGIYPALFSSYTGPEVRTILDDISKRWYTPDNSAIFISGNISAEKAYNTAVKYFGKWTGSTKIDRTSDAFKKEQTSRQKKFVLADKEFSKDLTQVVVEFADLSPTEADILNTSFNSVISPYKSLMLENPEVSVRSRDYLASDSIHDGKSSRLMLQALMEEPYSFVSDPEIQKPNKRITPANQADSFVETVKKSAELSTGGFMIAQKSTAANYRKKIGNSVGAMQLIADWWAFDPTLKDGNYYQNFLTLPSTVDSVDPVELAKKISDVEPFVFVMVNTDVYKSYKASFDRSGYELVTRDKGCWYHDQLALSQALENEKAAKNQKEKIELAGEDKETLSPAANFYYQNSTQFSDAILDNGIPILVKEAPNTQTVAISLSIAGGEAASPKNQRLMRTVLVNAYAKNLQDGFTFMKSSGQIAGDTSIKARTETTVSYITVECVKTDFQNVMAAMLNALVYGEISASNADRLVNEQAAQWNSKMIILDYQMEYNALKYLYRGTVYADIYDQEANVLSDTTIDTITKAYMDFLDASLYSFVIVGDTDIDSAKKIAEQSFGILKEQTERTKTYTTIPLPDFKNSARKVKLHHLYTTTLTKEQAGTEVPILIPTSEFYDPVQYYFQCPEESHERNIQSCLLSELRDRIQKYLPKDTSCSVVSANNFLRLASIRVNGILHTANFLSAYKKARREILQELEIPDESFVRDMKQMWIYKTMLQTQTNIGTVELIQRGMEINLPYQYLEDYLSMELSVREEFLDVMKKYFPETPNFIVTSADSKN
ncbi:MAG: insulinase family protein [Treponema sp.]|nr:insulinase family protein [Treponema sp.]